MRLFKWTKPAQIGTNPHKLAQTAPAGIALGRAMFCADCETISAGSRLGRCPHCDSASVVPLSRWVTSLAHVAPCRVIHPMQRLLTLFE
jgi:hypothetical protein